jgi:hypothetical protein
LNSAVATVAVETVFSLLRVVSESFDIGVFTLSFRHSGMRRKAQTRNPYSRRVWPLGHSRKKERKQRALSLFAANAASRKRGWLWIPGSRLRRAPE